MDSLVIYGETIVIATVFLYLFLYTIFSDLIRKVFPWATGYMLGRFYAEASSNCHTHIENT